MLITWTFGNNSQD